MSGKARAGSGRRGQAHPFRFFPLILNLLKDGGKPGGFRPARPSHPFRFFPLILNLLKDGKGQKMRVQAGAAKSIFSAFSRSS